MTREERADERRKLQLAASKSGAETPVVDPGAPPTYVIGGPGGSSDPAPVVVTAPALPTIECIEVQVQGLEDKLTE